MAQAPKYRKAVDRENEGPIQGRYRQFAASREPFLATARKCAALTVPYLLPPVGRSRKVREPYQSLGAHGVNNLGQKVLLALFPPGWPFFRFSIGEFELQQIIDEAAGEIAAASNAPPEAAQQFAAEVRKSVLADLEGELAKNERAIMREFELLNNRPTDSEAVKHLIVTGNVLRHCPVERGEQPRMYDLSQYIVNRDPDGTVLEIIVCEEVTAVTVDPDVREACGLDPDDGEPVDKTYRLYTRVWRDYEGRTLLWREEQELNGVTVPDSEGTYPIDVCPWMPLRWTKIDGQDYGRGHVENYYGALRALDGLTQALLENAVGASRCLVFVNPNSPYGTKQRDVARAANGAVVTGNAQDVTFLRSDKYHDLQIPLKQVEMLYQELGQAFLLNSSTQRDAERVTAYEIQVMSHELEIALGGVYATLSHEYQMPILLNLMAAMRRTGSLPKMPADVKPTIITGTAALGRSSDLERLMQYGQFLQQFPPAIVGEYLKFSDIFKQAAVAVGLDYEQILNSEEEVAAQRQQQMEAQLQQQAVGPAINAVGGMATAAPPAQ